MQGGKNKKMAKKMMEENERSVTDKSLTEADAVFEMFGAEMTDAMLGMSELGMTDEKTEEMLKRTRSNFPQEVGSNPEPVIEEIRRFFQEQRWRGKDQQEETRVQSTDERGEANGSEEVRSGRGSAGCVRGKGREVPGE